MSLYKQRRIAIKKRARELSTVFFLKLLLALAAVLVVTQLLPELAVVLSDSLFADRFNVRLFGYAFSVSSQLILLLTFVITSPLQMALTDFLIRLARDYRPMKISEMFIWLGDFGKFCIAMKYALWQTVLTVVLFPLVFFPGAFYSEYSEKLMNSINTAVEQGADSVAEITIPQADWKLTLLMVGLLLLYFAVRGLFMAVPYILVENPEVNVFKAAYRSVKVIGSHFAEFVLFMLSFIPYLILLVATSLLAAPFVLPFFYMAATLFIQKLRVEMGDRPPDPIDSGGGQKQ